MLRIHRARSVTINDDESGSYAIQEDRLESLAPEAPIIQYRWNCTWVDNGYAQLENSSGHGGIVLEKDRALRSATRS